MQLDQPSSFQQHVRHSGQEGMCVAWDLLCVLSIIVSYFRCMKNVNYHLLSSSVKLLKNTDAVAEKVLLLVCLHHGRLDILKNVATNLKFI